MRLSQAQTTRAWALKELQRACLDGEIGKAYGVPCARLGLRSPLLALARIADGSATVEDKLTASVWHWMVGEILAEVGVQYRRTDYQADIILGSIPAPVVLWHRHQKRVAEEKRRTAA